MENIITKVEDPETTSFEGWLDKGRKYWKARPERVIGCNMLYVVDMSNTVRAAGQVEGLLKDLDQGSGRVEILVRPQPDNEWIGRTIVRSTSRNPVTYMSEIKEA